MVSVGGRELTRGQIHFLRGGEGRSRRSFRNGLTPCPVNRCLVTSFDPNTARREPRDTRETADSPNLV